MSRSKSKRMKRAERNNKVTELETRIQSLTQELALARNGALGGNEDGYSYDLQDNPRLEQEPLSVTGSLVDEELGQGPMQHQPSNGIFNGPYGSSSATMPMDPAPWSHKRRRSCSDNGRPEAHKLRFESDIARYVPQEADPYAVDRAARVAEASARSLDPSYVAIAHYAYGHIAILERYVPNADDAYQMFHRFVISMTPQMPIVLFVDYTSAEAVLRMKPLLFLAIICVAAPIDVQVPLTREILCILADLIVVKNQRSLELIQALQIIALWYWPTDNSDARCDLCIGMACNMATALGMDTPRQLWDDQSKWSAKNPDISREGASAYLGCFILSTTLQMGLKQSDSAPIFDRVLLHSAVQTLIFSIDIDPIKLLVGHWALLLLTTPHAEQSSKANIDRVFYRRKPKRRSIRDTIAEHQSKLKDWQHCVPYHRNARVGYPASSVDACRQSLDLGSHALSLYIHRPATQLHELLARLQKDKRQHSEDSAADLGIFHHCVDEFHQLFAAFLKLSGEVVCSLPVFQLTHVAHAIFLVFVLEKAVRPLDDEQRQLLRVDNLGSLSSLEGLTGLLRDSTHCRPSRPVIGFLLLLQALQRWVRRARADGAVQHQTPAVSFCQTGSGTWTLDTNGRQPAYGRTGGDESRIDSRLPDIGMDCDAMRSSLSGALDLILARGDIDLKYFPGFRRLVKEDNTASLHE